MAHAVIPVWCTHIARGKGEMHGSFDYAVACAPASLKDDKFDRLLMPGSYTLPFATAGLQLQKPCYLENQKLSA